jgi:hypothetical protein
VQAAVRPALDVEAVLIAAQLVNVKGGPARAREAGKEPAMIAGHLKSGLAIKNPPQKNPQKNTHLKKPITNVFWVFLKFLIFMKIIQTFLFETDFS